MESHDDRVAERRADYRATGLRPQATLPGLRRALLPLLLPLAVLLAWQWLVAWRAEPGAAYGWMSLIPRPVDVLDVVVHPWRSPPEIGTTLAFSTATSSIRVAMGFALATIVGIPWGIWLGRSAAAERLFLPSLNMIRVVCPLAWMPLAILFLGSQSLAEALFAEPWEHDVLDDIQPAMVLIVAWGAVFPILFSSMRGAASVRRTFLENAQMMGASPYRCFRDITLPYAWPSIVTGMRIGLGQAWMVIVAAELYPGTRSGLGYIIRVAGAENTFYEYVFGAIVYIGVIGVAIDSVLRALERRAGRWLAAER